MGDLQMPDKTLNFYPQRTQKTLKFAGLVASFIETTLSSQSEPSDSFSGKTLNLNQNDYV